MRTYALFASIVTGSLAFAPRAARCAPPRAAFSALALSVEDTIGSADVVVFSKTTCPFCMRTKAVFANLGVDATIIELNEMEDGAETQAALADLTGQRTVPSVFIKGTHLGGNDDTQKALKSGDLEKMLAA